MTHPKEIEIGGMYMPQEWQFEKSYYKIIRNAYGYWATYYTTTDPSQSKGLWYPCPVNDTIAKSFPRLCKKIDAAIARKTAS